MFNLLKPVGPSRAPANLPKPKIGCQNPKLSASAAQPPSPPTLRGPSGGGADCGLRCWTRGPFSGSAWATAQKSRFSASGPFFHLRAWEAPGRPLGGLGGPWEAPGRPLGGPWEAPGAGRPLGGRWEAPGRPLQGSWEAPGRPRSPWEASGRSWEALGRPLAAKVLEG